MSSSSHAAALAAFLGIGAKSKSELIHDKKNPQKFKIPTETTKNQSSSTTGGPLGTPSGPPGGVVRRSSTATSQYKKPNPLTKSSTTGRLKPTPKLHIDLKSIENSPSTSPIKGSLPMNPAKSTPFQLQRADTTSTVSLALAAATVSAKNRNNTNNGYTNPVDYPPSTPKGINNHRSFPTSTSVSMYSQDSAGNDYFNLQSQANSNSTPLQLSMKHSTSQHSNLSTADMIQKVKNSIESRKVSSETKLPKANSSLDMINQVRNSINAKAKTATQSTTELSQKNQERLNEIRGTIDMKRIVTPRAAAVDPSNASFGAPPPSALSPLASTPLLSPIADYKSSRGSISGSSSPILAPRGPGDFERNEFHNSYSSILSSIHSSGSELVSIFANQQGGTSSEKMLDSAIKERDAPTIMVEHHGHDDSEPVIVQNLGLLPGLVPGLVGELLNGLTVVLNEPQQMDQNTTATAMRHAVLEEGSIANNAGSDLASIMLAHTETDKRVPRRKPPPPSSPNDFDSGNTDYVSDLPSFNLNKLSLPEGGGGSLLFEDSHYSHPQQEDSSTSRFPQFPGLSNHRKNKSKSNIHIKESDFQDEESNDEADASEMDSETPNPVETLGGRQQIVKPVQKVQLKTTMRKTNKRKEKKLTFNENKPWKNHTDLSFVTEQERKRYEGVWVSNKGLYLPSVVTKLVGVDYGTDLDALVPETTPLTKEETSLTAARLSSKMRDDFNLEDNFHNQLSAELSQLIHGVVVKRIWLRSKLPKETLRAIWELVDFRHDGSLNKAEFIVGMWFVDQCLYGRKLPKKVDPVVWDSLGSIGLNVVLKKKGRR